MNFINALSARLVEIFNKPKLMVTMSDDLVVAGTIIGACLIVFIISYILFTILFWRKK